MNNCLCNILDNDNLIWFIILALLIVNCGNCSCGCGR